MKWQSHYVNKKLIVFDLDGTLAESRMAPSPEIRVAFAKLLEKQQVAVISGSSFERFKEQFLKSLTIPAQLLPRLYLFPTCATSFYRYNDGWQTIYEELLTFAERMRITYAFHEAFDKAQFSRSRKLYGELIEDRGSQISFSGLGQRAPIHLKKKWDPQAEKRLKIRNALLELIPEFEVLIGGATTIDVTRKGIDKAYGIGQIEKHLNIPRKDILFIGDALHPGGNDYPVYEAGVDCVRVSGPEETKKYVEQLIA